MYTLVRKIPIGFMCTRLMRLSAAAACILRPIKSSGLRSGFFIVFPIRTKLIVLFSFLGIAENFVCLVDFLELFFRCFIPLGLVGMIFFSKRSICLLDLCRCCRLSYTQIFVVIFVDHSLTVLYSICGRYKKNDIHHSATRTCAG